MLQDVNWTLSKISGEFSRKDTDNTEESFFIKIRIPQDFPLVLSCVFVGNFTAYF